MLRGIRAAIVDLDGTMVDTLGDFDVALNATLRELGCPVVGRADIERMVGKGSMHLIRSALVHGGLDGAGAQARLDEAWVSYQRHYAATNGAHSEVYPGVVEGLQALRDQGLALACVTNKPLGFARELLRAKGLAPYFSQVFGGDSFARSKPDPLPLIETCKALGSEPSRTLMVGDSLNDALAARAAGCPVALVTYGYNHGEPVRGVDADAYLDRLDELPARLQ
ncbi:MAG: phosphoglycolate phosphatase [Hydrogenophaga sp.]|uniref:phosphoglycolate phosphatase n=1 Tax=Hydrogenophaga sp. TaxID=1904254 RepID=UPI0016BAC5E1|nr:phosphoglycolate phosphatase [Hydrogenophaga sp.]NIM40075.1 phosphoglycolate phosphatase [Hydrogenophaga sp.]NIN25271.1 phosphoglycolate phosphatase [Hydrogenophaga sp.]NIN29838.1 phosphoglycolate phosphatase [Hydrogenophaga sp.]NIN54310.1 phosphoglycolate phosphatase [Hydrogenophaga sp.]NIO50723.1 phosphoglycolate phosphatase [Hydrogenophaga sp.]